VEAGYVQLVETGALQKQKYELNGGRYKISVVRLVIAKMLCTLHRGNAEQWSVLVSSIHTRSP